MAYCNYDELQAKQVQQAQERGLPTNDEWAFELWWLMSRPDSCRRT